MGERDNGRTTTGTPGGRGRRILWRAVRWLLAVVAVLVPSAVWGVATASAQGNLGPHTASYEVTLNGEVTVDLGPLGTLVIDSPLPLGLGGRVVVEEIPREITSIGVVSTPEALASDLRGYVQFFTGPEATVRVAVRALVASAVRRTALAACAIAASALLVRALLGRQRRAELAAVVRAHRAGIAAGTALVVLVSTSVTASVPVAVAAAASTDRTASAVFDGTALEGARITGRLAGVIDTYGGYVVDAYRENEVFYADAADSARIAWEDRAAREQRGGVEGVDEEPTASATPGAEADDSTQVVVEQADPAVVAGDTPEPVVMLVVSDLHCNVGMAEVISVIAELSGAQVILNAGDTTVDGTTVESYCVQAFADAVPDGATMVVADGNHDSAETSAQERDDGMRVLEGSVIEVAGVRILGDSDPRATRIGAGTTLVGDETMAEVGVRLAEVACDEADGVDLLLVHDPVVGDTAMEAGCATAQVSGHKHRRVDPQWLGYGTRYVSSSTAGASLGETTIGPLKGVAEMTVLRFDPQSRLIVDYRIVQVDPSADVTVGEALTWPGEPSDPLPGDWVD